MTTEGTLRHPSYLGLREDKKAEAVVVEKEAPVEEVAVYGSSKVLISNRDRVIDPEGGTTKGQLADHYAAVASIMLPWAGSRPISLVRCPQGRSKKCFFQKHDAGMFGDSVHQVAISEKDGHEEPYLYVDDADGLLTCVQMGTIEFHGWGASDRGRRKGGSARVRSRPRRGPDVRSGALRCLHFRDILKQIGLETFPMVTGGKGVHVVAPLTPRAEWPRLRISRTGSRGGRRGRSPRISRQRFRRFSARGASSSTICETSAARPPSCLIRCERGRVTGRGADQLEGDGDDRHACPLACWRCS
jgi:bifunctional non-homologous end joining protein LigD